MIASLGLNCLHVKNEHFCVSIPRSNVIKNVFFVTQATGKNNLQKPVVRLFLIFKFLGDLGSSMCF